MKAYLVLILITIAGLALACAPSPEEIARGRVLESQQYVRAEATQTAVSLLTHKAEAEHLAAVAATATAVAVGAQEAQADLPRRQMLSYGLVVVGLVVLTLAGVFSVLAYGDRLKLWASLVHPNRQGLYPLIQIKMGNAVAVHDPNRVPGPTTVYVLAGQKAILATIATPDTPELAGTLQRAQAVQAIVAGGIEKGKQASRELPGLFANPGPAAKALPRGKKGGE